MLVYQDMVVMHAVGMGTNSTFLLNQVSNTL